MSTPSNPSWTQFQNDYSTLHNRIEEYDSIEKEYAEAGTTYQQDLKNLPATGGSVSPLSSHNPWALFVKLIVLLLGAGANVLTDKVGCRASALKVEEGTNACNSALFNTTNNTTDTSNAGLIHEANGANLMSALCSPGSDLSKALGGDGSTGSLLQNFQTMRGWIYTGGAVSGDPTLPASGSSTTPQDAGIYFDASSSPKTGLLTSFAQMHANASQQGNLDDASGAASAISTTFGTNSTLLSGVQTSLQTMMTADSNSLSTILAVCTKMGSNLTQLETVATQNQIRG